MMGWLKTLWRDIRDGPLSVEEATRRVAAKPAPPLKIHVARYHRRSPGTNPLSWGHSLACDVCGEEWKQALDDRPLARCPKCGETAGAFRVLAEFRERCIAEKAEKDGRPPSEGAR